MLSLYSNPITCLVGTAASSATIHLIFFTCFKVCPKRVNSANCSNLGYVAVIMYRGTDFSKGCNSSSTFFGHGFDLFRS